MSGSDARQDVVIANRILGREGILDAYGHATIRHPERPDRFLMSVARAPELIEDGDVVEFALDGTVVNDPGRPLYIERFIHAAIYAARPDVGAVCHNHALSILPFSIAAETQLRPVIHTARAIGGDVPIWDIAHEFGPATDLLVRNMDHGRSLSRALGEGRLALMRGHGSVVVGGDVPQMVALCIAMDRNAQVQLRALQLGGIIPLHSGELDTRRAGTPANDNRAWEYWKRRAGF